MKVRELIERLRACDPEAEVLVPDDADRGAFYARLTNVRKGTWAIVSPPRFRKLNYKPQLEIEFCEHKADGEPAVLVEGDG